MVGKLSNEMASSSMTVSQLVSVSSIMVGGMTNLRGAGSNQDVWELTWRRRPPCGGVAVVAVSSKGVPQPAVKLHIQFG